MDNNTQLKKTMSSSVDIPYMFRQIRRAITLIVPIALIVGVLVYMWDDAHNQAQYTATVELVVVPRDNVVTKQYDSQINMATTRCLSVLNSSSLLDQIREECGGTFPAGTLTSEQIANTNIIKMVAVATDSKEALRLLRAGVNAYPAVAGYMESGYLLRRLNELSADNVTCNRDRALYKGLIVVGIILLLGFGVVLFVAFTTDKIHNESQAEELLDGNLIGSLAFVKKRRGEKAILINQEQVDISYIENVDRISTYIQRELEETNSKALMISSIKENEGKTTVISNIAINLAERGYRIALVDCDMRRPALVKIFQMADQVQANVSEVLTGQIVLGDARIEHKSGISMYLQKKVISEPDKMLVKETLGKVIDSIKEDVDFVLIDTPPIGIIRDSEIIASSIDKAVIVFCQDEVHAADINDSIDLLENAGTEVLGTIMNKRRISILEKQANVYSDYYYYYGYGYGDN